MKIVLLQSGPDYEVLILTSLLIGLQKRYANAQIIWVGEPRYFPLVKYNRRIAGCISIEQELTFATLSLLYNSDLCLNPCIDRAARRFVESIPAKRFLGFGKDAPFDRAAEFVEKILTDHLTTNKTILDLYYYLAGLQWSGEGYGLSYYPRQKQNKEHGALFHKPTTTEAACIPIRYPNELLRRFDVLNQFREIHTDDLFTAHAGIALRKHVNFYGKLNYRLEFFKNGRVIQPTKQD